MTLTSSSWATRIWDWTSLASVSCFSVMAASRPVYSTTEVRSYTRLSVSKKRNAQGDDRIYEGMSRDAVLFNISIYQGKRFIKVEKKFLQNSPKRISKSCGILHWFQKCAEVLSLAKGKKINRKTDFLGTEKKSSGTSWCKSSTHFWNQRKILLLLIAFAPTFEEIFFNSYKGGAFFGS